MARRTFSLPDELDRKLERYAEEHDLAISQVAQQALERFLVGSPADSAPAAAPPPPVQPDPPGSAPPPIPDGTYATSGQVHQIQTYVTGLVDYVDVLRNYIAQNSHPMNQPPLPFPPPPWWPGNR